MTSSQPDFIASRVATVETILEVGIAAGAIGMIVRVNHLRDRLGCDLADFRHQQVGGLGRPSFAHDRHMIGADVTHRVLFVVEFVLDDIDAAA
jgi:hypothetical protein